MTPRPEQPANAVERTPAGRRIYKFESNLTERDYDTLRDMLADARAQAAAAALPDVAELARALPAVLFNFGLEFRLTNVTGFASDLLAEIERGRR